MKRIISVIVLVIVLLVAFTGCGLTTARPEIKDGEFNFSVTYEFNGEIKTVSGIYACKFNGIDWALDGGYHRDWSGYIKGDEEEKLLEIGTTDDGGAIRIVLGFYPEYFMGDSEWKGAPEPYLTVTHFDGDGMSIQNEADVIANMYGVKIISYEYDEPIENSYK